MAKITKVVKKIPLPPTPVEPYVITTNVESIEMSFSPEEFLLLYNVFQKIGGNSESSARKFADSIYNNLDIDVLGDFSINKDDPFRVVEKENVIRYRTPV